MTIFSVSRVISLRRFIDKSLLLPTISSTADLAADSMDLARAFNASFNEGLGLRFQGVQIARPRGSH
jgi:hypothetical protein